MARFSYNVSRRKINMSEKYLVGRGQYILWPGERKSVEGRYNLWGRGDVIKPSNVLRQPGAL